MKFQFNSISLIFTCLLVFIYFTINHQVNGRALNRNIHDATLQNIEHLILALGKKPNTLTNFNDEHYLDSEADVDDHKYDDNDVSTSFEDDNQVLNNVNTLNNSDEIDFGEELD
ncbi:unnamed protein product [Rotaria sp. Silwood1]|nr:unnamed protein product [Rotaria sp. Silwood1]